MDANLQQRLADGIAAATQGRWRLDRTRPDRDRLLLDVVVPPADDGRPRGLTLEVQEAQPQTQAYKVIRGLAMGYRGKDLPGGAQVLDAALVAIADILDAAPVKPWQAPAETPQTLAERSGFPTPWQRFHLDHAPSISEAQRAAFRRNGHVLVRRAIAPDVVNAARPELLDALQRHWPEDLPPADQRADAYARSFTQITDRWPTEPVLRAFGLSRRLAALAASLLDVPQTRLFCEDWLVKEPGAGITPWHQDAAVMPFDADRSLTLWIPLQPVRQGDGLLRFATGSHRIGRVPIEDISDTSEGEFAAIIADHGCDVVTLPPVFPGDVSVHHGFTIHGALPNSGDRFRPVLALHCYADGARVIRPTTPKMERLLHNAAPEAEPGQPAVSSRWPPLPRLEVLVPEEPPVHLRARLTGPDGVVSEDERDLWIEDGLIRLTPGPGRRPEDQTLVPPGGILTAGLVESHGHISYPTEPDDPADTFEWMNARRADYARTGVTLIRDMGALSDAICGIVDVVGLPRVQPSGTMVIPHDDPPFTPTGPEELVAAFTTRVERGARWVKVFSDWSQDFVGRRNSGFGARDRVSYPPDTLAAAVAVAHRHHARVGSHCFTHAGARAAVDAGVDCLEHGWGVDTELVREMADKGVAWAPLVGIAPIMWADSVQNGDAVRATWVEERMTALRETLPLAESLGVTLLAGTDMFPAVTVADEVACLAELGVSTAGALGAGTWAARSYLGEPGLLEGASADLVLYRQDPRESLPALLSPQLVVIGGRTVAPSLAAVRPEFTPWSQRQTLVSRGAGGLS